MQCVMCAYVYFLWITVMQSCSQRWTWAPWLAIMGPLPDLAATERLNDNN